MIPIMIPDGRGYMADEVRENLQDVPMPEEKLQKCIQKAESGDAETQYDLGCYYDALAAAKKEYLVNELPSGSRWMRGASAIGEKDAFERLVAEERENAFAWFEKAAKQGHIAAIYALSRCYERGKGTASYPEKAQELLIQAAEKGYAIAQYDVGMQSYFGKNLIQGAVEIRQDYVAAVAWLKKSAEQGYSLAQYYLGVCYEEGLGVEQDFEEAFSLYEKSAASELAWALCAVGRCYENGRGVAQDIERAIEYYIMAAEQGDAEACEALDRLE